MIKKNKLTNALVATIAVLIPAFILTQNSYALNSYGYKYDYFIMSGKILNASNKQPYSGGIIKTYDKDSKVITSAISSTNGSYTIKIYINTARIAVCGNKDIKFKCNQSQATGYIYPSGPFNTGKPASINWYYNPNGLPAWEK